MKYTFYQALFLILMGSAHLHGGEQKTMTVKINNCSTTKNLYCIKDSGLVTFRIPHKWRPHFQKPLKLREPIYKKMEGLNAPTVLKIMEFSPLIKKTYAIALQETTKITITDIAQGYLRYKDQHGTVFTVHQVITPH